MHAESYNIGIPDQWADFCVLGKDLDTFHHVALPYESSNR